MKRLLSSFQQKNTCNFAVAYAVAFFFANFYFLFKSHSKYFENQLVINSPLQKYI